MRAALRSCLTARALRGPRQQNPRAFSSKPRGLSGTPGGNSGLIALAVGGGGVLGLAVLADRWDTGGMALQPDLGAGASHGLLGESHTIQVADGLALKFAKEVGAEQADAEVGGAGVWTGRFLWASGGELAQYLIGKGPEYFAGKRVLELGCGCGLAGLTCAALGAKETLLTDQITEGAETNLALNAAELPDLKLSERCHVKKLRWGNAEDYAAAEGPFDVIVGSDIMQEGGDIVGEYKTLADTIAALSGPKTEVWLCNPIANPIKLAQFFGETKKHGFKSKVVKPPMGFDPVAIILFHKPDPEADVEAAPAPAGELEPTADGGEAKAVDESVEVAVAEPEPEPEHVDDEEEVAALRRQLAMLEAELASKDA